jgi:hypothetical protein
MSRASTAIWWITTGERWIQHSVSTHICHFPGDSVLWFGASALVLNVSHTFPVVSTTAASDRVTICEISSSNLKSNVQACCYKTRLGISKQSADIATVTIPRDILVPSLKTPSRWLTPKVACNSNCFLHSRFPKYYWSVWQRSMQPIPNRFQTQKFCKKNRCRHENG